MPQCPYCNAKMADSSVQCPRCGHPRGDGAGQAQQAENDRRFPFWTILPWTLLAAAALFFLPHLLSGSKAQNPAPVAARSLTAPLPSPLPAPAAVSPNASPVKPDASASANSAPTDPASASVPAPAVVAITPAVVPLTVTLSSAGSSRHVSVGKPIMISAYASLPPGQSATLAISYGKDDGPKALLALAQGSLSSAAWTPTAPGLYRFTASALDSRKNGAFSRRLTILVDAPPASVTPRQPPAKRTAAVITAAIQAAAPNLRVKTLPPPPPYHAPPYHAPLHHAPLHHAQPYHVAAATFRVKRIAETLAGALRQRGFHAFARSDANGGYRVETGDFARRADADKQAQLLKRDGYPSSVFQTR